jgi:hypothetical protein
VHGAKFGHPEDPVIPANPIGPVKDGTFGGQFYKEGEKQEGQTNNTKRDKGDQDIKASFHYTRPLPAGCLLLNLLLSEN